MTAASDASARPAPGAGTILRVAGLTGRITGQTVIEDVSFEVPATGVTAHRGLDSSDEFKQIRRPYFVDSSDH